MNGDVPDYEALKDRWERARPHTYTCAELERLLERRFGAYEIPLTTISDEDYANDDDVDERRIYKLMTITDPEVIATLQTDEERAQLTTAPAEVDQDWRGLLTGEADALSYDLLNLQHGQGTRISVVLEADGDHVSGFKVYGLSFALQDQLTALVGLRDMRPGDTSDPGFQWHLECLDRLGML